MDIAVLAESMKDQLMTEDHVPHASHLPPRSCKKMVTARLAPDTLELMLPTEIVLETHVMTENTTQTPVPALNAQTTSGPTTKTSDVSKTNVTLGKFRQSMVDAKIAQFIKNQMELRRNVLH